MEPQKRQISSRDGSLATAEARKNHQNKEIEEFKQQIVTI